MLELGRLTSCEEIICSSIIYYKTLILHLLKGDMHEENSTLDILNLSNVYI